MPWGFTCPICNLKLNWQGAWFETCILVYKYLYTSSQDCRICISFFFFFWGVQSDCLLSYSKKIILSFHSDELVHVLHELINSFDLFSYLPSPDCFSCSRTVCNFLLEYAFPVHSWSVYLCTFGQLFSWAYIHIKFLPISPANWAGFLSPASVKIFF